MNIPAPIPLGRAPTFAIAAPFGAVLPEQLETATALGRAPVALHYLGNEQTRQARGPRELRDLTVDALERFGWTQPWGLGGVCRSTEDAAQFAVAGFTWFTLDLCDHLEPRWSTMSLDELDAAIVALEDRGAFPLGWHDSYLQQSIAREVDFSEETLARVAVRYGAALLEAEQIVQAIRVSSSERGDLPDLEISFTGGHLPTSPEELAFVTAEAGRRGLIHGGITRFAPCLGMWCQPGGQSSPEASEMIRRLATVCPPTAVLSVPDSIAGAEITGAIHRNAEHTGRLLWLRHLAQKDPAKFRDWVKVAHQAFPTAAERWEISTTEDDVRFLPTVADDALVSTFLETMQGRQLLLATWSDVADLLGPAVPVT
jgi:hypothetical protein